MHRFFITLIGILMSFQAFAVVEELILSLMNTIHYQDFVKKVNRKQKELMRYVSPKITSNFGE